MINSPLSVGFVAAAVLLALSLGATPAVAQPPIPTEVPNGTDLPVDSEGRPTSDGSLLGGIEAIHQTYDADAEAVRLVLANSANQSATVTIWDYDTGANATVTVGAHAQYVYETPVNPDRKTVTMGIDAADGGTRTVEIAVEPAVEERPQKLAGGIFGLVVLFGIVAGVGRIRGGWR